MVFSFYQIGHCGIPSERDQVDATGSMADEQLFHVAFT